MASTEPNDFEPAGPVVSRLWWAVPAVALVALMFIASLVGSRRSESGSGTSYDSSERGYRGVYLIMEELGYPVARSRRASGGDVRWILFPTNTSEKEAHSIDDWVKRGGCALLALSDSAFAHQIGFSVTVAHADSTPNDEKQEFRGLFLNQFKAGELLPAAAPDVATICAGKLQVEGSSRGKIWARIDDQPLVTIHPHGRGEIWLLNRPDVLANGNLRQADNAIFACRLADAMLEERPNSKLLFDEYCHGLHDRPSVFSLLFTPPVLAATVEGLLLTLLLLWRFGPRFGSLYPAPPPSRRSKEEFLDAMAELLARKGDRAEAFRTVRDEFLNRLERELSLPAGTPIEATVREAARRRGIASDPLLKLLTAPAPPEGKSTLAFLNAIHQLEIVAHECFPRVRSR